MTCLYFYFDVAAAILEVLLHAGLLTDGADVGLEILFGYLMAFYGVSNFDMHVLRIGFSLSGWLIDPTVLID